MRDRESTFITGISMGGYGSLKIAFGRPDQFAAVAAIQPLLEPGFQFVRKIAAHDPCAVPRPARTQGRPARLREANLALPECCMRPTSC